METTARPRQRDWCDSRAFFQALLADIGQLPGVRAVGAMMGPPGHVESDSGYWIDRMPEKSPFSSARSAAMNVIAPGTFEALSIPIREGRDFTDGDMAGRPRVAIVNHALARAAFGGRDAVGRVIIAGYDSLDQDCGFKSFPRPSSVSSTVASISLREQERETPKNCIVCCTPGPCQGPTCCRRRLTHRAPHGSSV